MGCDGRRQDVPCGRCYVSIHAPARGATVFRGTWHRHAWFQSTHPRGVRLDEISIEARSLGVSIHAPARGATPFGEEYRTSTKVSIHAPARGATNIVLMGGSSSSFQSTHPRGVRPLSPPNNRGLMLFQSTHPRGVRRLTCSMSSLTRLVSIHAPARGATCRAMDGRCVHGCFNPRTREGCGSRTAANNNRNCRFNPRTHMGATSCRTCVAQLGSYFNPRARVGRDLVDQREQRVGHVSIHTPKMGATCT